MINLPVDFECNYKNCPHFDRQGSEHSCNGGSLSSCPIANSFVDDKMKISLEIGNLVISHGKFVIDAFELGRRYEGEIRGTNG